MSVFVFNLYYCFHCSRYKRRIRKMATDINTRQVRIWKEASVTQWEAACRNQLVGTKESNTMRRKLNGDISRKSRQIFLNTGFTATTARYTYKSYRNNQQDATVYQNLLFQCLSIAQHVSSDTPLIIRGSKTVIAASGFTYFLVAGPLRWLNHCSYTICAWGTLGGTRSRLTVVGGMASRSPQSTPPTYCIAAC